MQFDITVDEAIKVTATRDRIEVVLGNGADVWLSDEDNINRLHDGLDDWINSYLDRLDPELGV
jgi:hypothetical protein